MDLKSARKLIRNAWIAGVVSGAIILIAMSTGIIPSDVRVYAIIYVFLFFGLSFGIYKHSRACAVIMVIFLIAGKIENVISRQSSPGMVYVGVVIIFLYFYCQGVRGTFAYHKLKKLKKWKIIRNRRRGCRITFYNSYF